MKKTQSTGILVMSCISFLGLGVITAAIGPSLPDLAQRSGSSLAGAGGVYTGLFFGALAVQAATGALLDRVGIRPILLISLLALGAGLGLLPLAPGLTWLLLLSVLAGLGHGAVDVALNVMVAQAFPQRRAAAVNLLNVFFGVGAILGPAAASLSLNLWDTAVPALWLGAGLQLLLLPFLYVQLPRQKPADLPAEGGAGQRGLLASPLLWSMAGVILLYVGLENGMGGWVSTYMQQTSGLNPASAALTASAFWMALTGGRLLAALVGLRLSATRLLGISLATATAGALVLTAGSGRTGLSIAGILLLGLGFGPVFPTTLAKATAAFPQAAGAAASLVVASGSVGGMLLPWLQGVVLATYGPYAAILLTLAGCLVMLACFGLLNRLQKRARAQAVQPGKAAA